LRTQSVRNEDIELAKRAGIVLLVAAAVAAFWAYRHRPRFDADAIARAETQMWQAYYAHDPVALYRGLVRMLDGQFGLSAVEAASIARNLASAAVLFQEGANHESQVMPALEAAYSQLKKDAGGSFDPREAARAELDWWAARRIQGQDSVENVGEKIAKLYAVLYGKDRPAFHEAGLLRAKAANLRDRGGDWNEIERLLRQSYGALVSGL
jgi:hypothetical protein